MNKKGFIFTFISVVLVSVILLAFMIQYTSRTKVNIEKTNTEIETMNSFVRSLNDDYLPRALKISGNQAILALLHRMSVNDMYMTTEDEGGNAQNFIRNAIVDGDYDWNMGLGNDPELLELMRVNDIDYRINNITEEIIYLANFTGINFYFDVIQKQDIDISQSDPWNINLSIEITYGIKNKDESVLWEYTRKEIKTSIPIIYFVDPIYLVANDEDPEDGINITINKTIYDLPGEIDPHVENTNFLACNQAPSFLNRMQGITDVSPQGIESMVNVKSNVLSSIDYQYILGIGPQLVQIWDSGYYIDQTHSDCYDLGDE